MHCYRETVKVIGVNFFLKHSVQGEGQTIIVIYEQILSAIIRTTKCYIICRNNIYQQSYTNL